MAQTGYVYILTNPSFKEDWVKIGKSSRPVDVRSKELDNTAVPLPFEIYATIKTVKYSEVEKLVHKTIDRLTDLRIRQNREFFNVKPEVALDIFKDIAATLDDAEITVYRDNVSIHLSDENTDTDKDTSGANTSGTKALKKTFWEHFISNASSDVEFSKQFSIHKGIPRHSYDLAVGTTLCNIYLVANRRKLYAGLYFHGKDTFNSLLPLKERVESIVGSEVHWDEYEKDASITVNSDFSLEDNKSYDEAYSWLKHYAVRFGDVAKELVLSPVAPAEPEMENDTEIESGKMRPRFRFSMVGIRIGEFVTFTPTGLDVRVASDNQVEYNGRIYKLSPFVGTFMPADKRNTSGAYQGSKYFSYKGEVLDDMRKRIEQED